MMRRHISCTFRTDKTTNAYRHVGFVVWTHKRKLYGDPDAPQKSAFGGKADIALT